MRMRCGAVQQSRRLEYKLQTRAFDDRHIHQSTRTDPTVECMSCLVCHLTVNPGKRLAVKDVLVGELGSPGEDLGLGSRLLEIYTVTEVLRQMLMKVGTLGKESCTEKIQLSSSNLEKVTLNFLVCCND